MSSLQSSGPISLGQIQSEFGGSNPIGLGEYYRNGGIVPNTATTSDIPQSNSISIGDFYGTQDSSLQDKSFSLYKSTNGNSSGVGLTTQSSTASPSSFSTTTRQRFYQPVFRAGTNFLTSLNFSVACNEDNSQTNDMIVFYGGTDSSNVTNAVYRWHSYQSNQGGSLGYTLTFNANGSINSLTFTGGAHNTSILILQTPAVNADHRWYGFSIIRPVSVGKPGQVMNLSLTNTLQPD